MLKRSNILAIGMMVFGCALGYAAASGQFAPFWPTAQAASKPVDDPASSLPGVSRSTENPAPQQLLPFPSRRDPSHLVASQATGGKKPNILFIMGDDIGWYNPSLLPHGDMGYES